MALFKKDRRAGEELGQNTMVIRLKGKIDFESRLRKITNSIHSSPNIDAILLDLKDSILGLLDAERITIYAVAEEGNEIYSKVKDGKEVKEFRVAINNTSIAGYVAKK